MPGQSEGGLLTRLGPGLTAFLALDVVLVAVFAVLLVTTLRDGADDGGPSASPAAEETPQVEESPEENPDQDAEDVGAVASFVLPSGNIHCQMTDTSATCTILQFQFEAPELPEGCAGSVGSTLTVEAGTQARFDCVEGDPPPAPEGAALLDYGEQSTVGEMTCNSSTNGVLCRHDPSGEGFSVARAGYIVF